MWEQLRSKAGGIRAFFPHWGCGVVVLAMPYLWALPRRDGSLHPHSIEPNKGNL